MTGVAIDVTGNSEAMNTAQDRGKTILYNFEGRREDPTVYEVPMDFFLNPAYAEEQELIAGFN